MLELIKKANTFGVYLNTTTTQYELWLVGSNSLIEQLEVYSDLEDALEDLNLEEHEYEEFFDGEDENSDWMPDISAEDLAEWQAASAGMNYNKT